MFAGRSIGPLSWPWLAALGLAACGKAPPRSCNGSAVNCARRFDQVTFAATHDAFAYASGGPVHYTAPNQDRPIPDQLAYGIRGLGLRPSPYGGTDPSQKDVIYVTHNYTDFQGILGTEPLQDILDDIKTFLDENPSEVLSLFCQDTIVTPLQVAALFEQVGLGPYLFTYDPAKGWPTLEQMVGAGTRLVVFDDGSPLASWQLPMWSYLVETNYNITNADQFTCGAYDGALTNPLYFINQFIYQDDGDGILLASATEATIANDATAAYDRALSCWHQVNKIPNFIYVDFYLEGNVKQAVDQLNALPR